MLKIILFLFSFTVFAQNDYFQSVGIGNPPPFTAPPNLLLETLSTTKASRPFPRLTEVQRDALTTPALGFFIFNTDRNSLDFRDTVAWLTYPVVNFLRDSTAAFPDPLLNPDKTVFDKENQLIYQSRLIPTGQKWVSTVNQQDFSIAYPTTGIIRTLDARIPTYNIATGKIDNVPSFDYQFETEEALRTFPGGDGYAFPIIGTAGTNRPLFIGVNKANPTILSSRVSKSYDPDFLVLGMVFVFTDGTIAPVGLFNIPGLARTSVSAANTASLYGFGLTGFLLDVVPNSTSFNSSVFDISEEGINFYTNPNNANIRQYPQQLPVMLRNLMTTASTDVLPPASASFDVTQYEDPANLGTLIPVVPANGYCGVITMYEFPSFNWRYPKQEFPNFPDALNRMNLISQSYTVDLLQGEQIIAVMCYTGGITDFNNLDSFKILYLVGQASVAGGRIEPPDDSVERRHMEPSYRNDIETAIASVGGNVMQVEEIVLIATPPIQDGYYVLTQANTVVVAGVPNQANDVYKLNGATWTFIRHSVPQDIVMLNIVPQDTTTFTTGYFKFNGITWDFSNFAFNPDGIGINAGPALDPSAILEIGGTTRGILLPRVTTAQKNAIATPTDFLFLVDTDLQRFQYRNTAGSWSSFGDVYGPSTSATNTFSLFADNTGKNLIGQSTLYYDIANSRIGVGTSTPTSIFDITSTTSGFLPPRMTEVQRDSVVAPPAGSFIYNTTTNQINVWNGTGWVLVGGGGGQEGSYDRLTATAFIRIGCGKYINGQLTLIGEVNATWPAGSLASARIEIGHSNLDRGTLMVQSLGQDGGCTPLDAVRVVTTGTDLCLGVRLNTCGGAWGGGTVRIEYTPQNQLDDFLMAIGVESNDNWSLLGQLARYSTVVNGVVNDY